MLTLWALLAASGAAGVPEVEVCAACPLTSIAQGLAATPPGGRLRVHGGVYREHNLEITRPLELVGVDRPVLDIERRGDGLVVTADHVAIRGFEFRHSALEYLRDPAAVRLVGVTDCRVEDNRFVRNIFAVHASRVRDCVVAGNIAHGEALTEAQSGNAYHVFDSRRVTIDDNVAEGHRDGIYLEFTEDSWIRGNTSAGNLRYGLHFMYAQDSTYAGNDFVANGAGVAIMYSRRVDMHDNRFRAAWGTAAFGLLVKEVNDATLVNNEFVDNTYGLYLEGANRLRVEGNRFGGNGWALRVLSSCTDVAVRRNRFAGNTFDVATNSASGGELLSENVWDRYRGYDLDRDGFGDVPFRPVSLFSRLIEDVPPLMIMLRSPFMELLDWAERRLPMLSSNPLSDDRPAMGGLP